jgi:formylglycine-generating enzyme required for sulfatase activity
MVGNVWEWTARRTAANLLTRDEARRIAANNANPAGSCGRNKLAASVPFLTFLTVVPSECGVRIPIEASTELGG